MSIEKVKEYFKQFGIEDKIIELSQQYDEKTITEAIERLKNISFADINFKPTASWLLKDNNFERVMNGEFESNTEEVKFEY